MKEDFTEFYGLLLFLLFEAPDFAFGILVAVVPAPASSCGDPLLCGEMDLQGFI